VCSYDRKAIKWQPIIWGLFLQMFLGFIIMRTDGGFAFFEALGKEIGVFL
jgi:CNT family concentrative nucleoside transporter